MQRIVPEKDLRSILLHVEKPGRYTGGEYGIIRKNDDALLYVAVSYPDLYEIGMSNQAIRIIYNILNCMDGISCERVFAPAPDFENELRTHSLPLYSLESGRPLSYFDVIAFSLGYELTITNVLNILDLGGINLFREKRTQHDPIILAGGPAITNPAPFQDFFDCIFIGEAEEWLKTTFRHLLTLKKQGARKSDLLDHLCSHKSMWSPLKTGTVHRSVVPSFYKNNTSICFPIPNIKTVQDHGVIEIMRGCPNGCRFCQATYYYRPQRVKPFSRILKEAEELVFRCGYREITLSSLSSGDFPELEGVVKLLHDDYARFGVSFSLPSLRIDSLSLTLFKELVTVRKSGLTFAIESAYESGQQSLNKCIPFTKIKDILTQARNMGFRHAKFYFMIGLPGFIDTEETDEVIEYIINLQKETGIYLHINFSTFVPKPHTPFQWEEQLEEETAFKRIMSIKKALKRKSVKISFHSPFQSFIEGMIARGDERVGDLIYKAFSKGARLDAWEDYCRREIWKEVCSNTLFNVTQETYRKRSLNEKLPWHNISLGSSLKFLKNEHHKAQKYSLTPPCDDPCLYPCGTCKNKSNITKNIFFNAIKNDIHHKQNILENTLSCILFSFEKKSKSMFLSHLDLVRIFERAFLRCGYFIKMSSGFNPKPKLEFANPLTLGFSSQYEIARCFLFNFSENKSFINKLNETLPEGISLTNVKKLQPVRVGEKIYSLMSLYWGSDYVIDFFSLASVSLSQFDVYKNIYSIKKLNDSNYLLRYKILEKNISMHSILKQVLNTDIIHEYCTVERLKLYARNNDDFPISYFDRLQ